MARNMVRYALMDGVYHPIRMRETDPEEWIRKSDITHPTTFYENLGTLDNPNYEDRGVFIYNHATGMLRGVRDGEVVQEEQINRFSKSGKKSVKKSGKKSGKKSVKKSVKKSAKKSGNIDISDELLNAFSRRAQLCNKIEDLNALKLDISKYVNKSKRSKLLESFFKRIQGCNRIEDLNRIKLDLSAYDTLRDLRRKKVI